MTEVFINNELADTNAALKIILDKIVSEYKNPTKLTGSYTYDFTLPLTNRNKRIFHNIQDIQKVKKFIDYDIDVYVDGTLVISGVFKVKEVNRLPFANVVGFITATKIGRLGDILLNTKLRDIKSFTAYDFNGMPDVLTNIDDDTNYTPLTSEFKFTYLAESFNQLLHGQSFYHYTDFGISHFVAGIVKNIFADLGYDVDGDIFNDDTFNRLMLLYSNSNGDTQKYNYGKLNPFQASIPITNSFSQYQVYGESTRIERDTDYVYVFEPAYTAYDGDLSLSLGGDGVYTAKYTGDYTLRYTSTAFAGSNSGAAITGLGQFVVFRCIDNNEFLPNEQLPYTSSFDLAGANNFITDLDTLNIGTANTFTTKLVEGRQYRVQHYVSVPKASSSSFIFYYDAQITNSFRCTACNGSQTINLADFLPDLTQKEFLLGIFKMFNLYYTIDVAAKQVTLFTRDEFFALNADNTFSLDEYCKVESFKDFPIPQTEIDSVFYKYEEDEGDHILAKTNYLTLLGNVRYKDSEALPFAPLSFYKIKINSTNTLQPYIPVPAIVAASDSTDQSVLSEEHFNSFSYSPRICLYLGNKVLKESLKTDGTLLGTAGNPAIMFTTFVGGYVGVQPFGSYTLPTASDYHYFPMLSFFDLPNQPCYEIVIDTTRNEFSLQNTTTQTVYQITNNTDFLTNDVPEVTSLALIGEKSLFQGLYQNDIRITNYSNYSEGKIKMNSFLYNKLTGRNILILDNDQYLLERIYGYQLGADVATIRIYRIM